MAYSMGPLPTGETFTSDESIAGKISVFDSGSFPGFLVSGDLVFTRTASAFLNISVEGLFGFPATWTGTINGTSVGVNDFADPPGWLADTVFLFTGTTYTFVFINDACADSTYPTYDSRMSFQLQNVVLTQTGATTTSISVDIGATVAGNTIASDAVVSNVRYRVHGSGSAYSTLASQPGPGATITGLAASTSYDVYWEYVKGATAVNLTGSISVFSTLSPPVPSIPTGLAVSSTTTTTITMVWNASTGSPTSYSLRYRVTSTTPWTTVTGIAALTEVVTDLVPGQFYDFQVEAVNGSGESGWSTTVVGQAVPLPQPAPGQPQSLVGYRGISGVNWNGMVLVGDGYAGVIGRMSFDKFTEYGNTMRGLITTPPIQRNRNRIFVPWFEIDVQAGVGMTLGDGVDPVWVLDWSRDGGMTWSTLQVPKSMGKKGQYLRRLIWTRLGQSRQWIFRLQSTDPVRRVIIGTYADLVEGME